MDAQDNFKPRFTRQDVCIHSKKRVYQGFFAIDSLEVDYPCFNGGRTPVLRREIFERDHNAVAILPYDPVSDEVALIEQFRPGALQDKLTPWLIEIVAGMIDDGESEIEAALREVKEEVGLKLKASDLHLISSLYPSPGGTSEKVSVFIAKADLSHLSKHGGLEREHEDIRIFKVSAADAFAHCADGRINNCASLVSLLSLELHHAEIRRKFNAVK